MDPVGIVGIVVGALRFLGPAVQGLRNIRSARRRAREQYEEALGHLRLLELIQSQYVWNGPGRFGRALENVVLRELDEGQRLCERYLELVQQVANGRCLATGAARWAWNESTIDRLGGRIERSKNSLVLLMSAANNFL